jgi:hypothetical protein
MEKQDLYEDGIEEAKKSYAVLENILFLVLLTLGFMGMYPLGISGIPLVSILYALFALIMLTFVLRKHLCTGCYYYDKWCHCGWGKLSSAMYKKDSGNQKWGGILASLTWGIIMVLPIIGMILVVAFGKVRLTQALIYFIPFLILVGINGIMHKIDCEKCKMRFLCPGSAAKSNRQNG